MRASRDDRDDYKRQRDLDDQAERARRELIDQWLAVPAAGLARAVIESEGFKAVAELRRVNKALRGGGFQYPLGASGVEDLINHLGVVQLHEDQLALALEMIEAVAGDDRFQGQGHQDLIYYLRSVAARQ